MGHTQKTNFSHDRVHLQWGTILAIDTFSKGILNGVRIFSPPVSLNEKLRKKQSKVQTFNQKCVVLFNSYDRYNP